MGQIYKYLEKFSRYTEFTLKDVGRLIKKLIGKYNNELYQVHIYFQILCIAVNVKKLLIP